MKRLIKESGIRDINNIAKRYKKAKIYFHQDLDGVTTAIAMKNYLEQHGIEVVDAEVIQYGDKEFAIKKPEGEGDVMPVLVDFAHGKPMFVIHTDHHDSQAGVEKDTATSFKHSRSNVETISQTLSPKEIFPSEDIMIISTVDSANFAVNKITPEMVMNFLFKFDKDESIRKNKITMGLVTNKLLLAFKNKPRFLEELVLNSKPSLLSILNNIKKIVTEKGYAKPEELATNQQNYIEKQSKSENVKRVGNIIVQYGGGSMTKAGSYDRYTPFKNNPDADFIVIAWPMGLVQASCNPFKEDRSLKGVDLGEMKNEVLQKFESMLKGMNITFGSIKRISESSADYSSVGFTYKDMVAIYGNAPSFKVNGGEKINEILNNISSRLYRTLSDKQKDLLEKVTVSGWDVIMANSGGHKCITNISGMMYLFSKRKNNQTIEVEFSPELQPIANYSGSNTFVKDIKSKLLKYGNLSPKQIEIATSVINKEGGNTQKEEYSSYVELTKAIQDEFVRVLNGKIESQGNLQESINKSNLNKPFVFKVKGNVYNKPGAKIKYVSPNEEVIGYSNILDFDNSYTFDWDVERFDKNRDKYCVRNCDKGFFNGSNSVYLHDLRVHDEHQGKGYSKKLMSMSHKLAKDKGFKYVTLITACDNTPAQNLYNKLGYILHQTDGVKDFYYKKL